MDKKDQEKYLEEYEKEKKKGFNFFPDILFKDIIVSFVIFIILIGLAYFIGSSLEERANPADTSYTPRPEWYFLFLFQLLKYFPGNLEVLGVVVIPTILIILLFLLPVLDRSTRRHFLDRPIITGLVVISVIGISFLTIQSVLETPPPAELTGGDPIAALYLDNCSVCHGPSISVSPGTNLHEIIAQGNHEGMPAWSGDLSSDQIDALAGFILSPGGVDLYADNCAGCHQSTAEILIEPIELKKIIDEGPNHQVHTGLEVPVWSEVLSLEERTDLLNFLVAPDGQRLFVVNCSSCHGNSISFSGEEDKLIEIISQGGLHLEMPPWQGNISSSDIDTLAYYVVDPTSDSEGEQLFSTYCTSCHGERIPQSEDFESAREIISSGGSHETMPVWGEILTDEQLIALVDYTISLSEGSSVEIGRDLYASNCTLCHGEFGEGGVNPSRPGDIIAPISTSEYLATRDDISLRAIIAQGQPNFGMSPFGSSFGGPLDDEQIDALVAFIRSWQQNPPVELPPEISLPPVEPIISSQDIFNNLCSQCHGTNGEGGLGPSLIDQSFREQNTPQEIFDTINLGHEATAMIAWGEVLTSEQINLLVEYILSLGDQDSTQTFSFTSDVLPIFNAKCNMCHGTLGGWDGTTYSSAITSGNHAPVIIPGDVENSLLAQKIIGTQTIGTIMPPGGKLLDNEIQIILEWIKGGAQE